MSFCLVTGGAGFIGSHLVEALVAQGHAVRVLDNLSTGSMVNLAKVRNKIDWLNGDLNDLDCARAAVHGVELIFHQASLPSVHRSLVDPLPTHQVCANGTLHLLMAAREAGVRRVIYGASASAYGDGKIQPRRESEQARPVSPFGVAKLTGEYYCIAYSSAYGLETVRLRYFNAFGPRQRSGGPFSAVVPLFLEALLAGRPPVIFGDGRQSRDFTYVEDIVQANLLAAASTRASGRVYNIASGRSITLLELLGCMNDLLGTDIEAVHRPARPGDIRHSQADISKAQAELGYCPCTDLEHGLTQCIAYYGRQRSGSRGARHELCHLN